MSQLFPFIAQESVITFMLLFIRFSSLFAFMPFFSHTSVPASVKGALALYFTIVFYSVIPTANVEMTSDAGFNNLRVR